MNENELMAEFASNLWENFIKAKVNDMLSDSVTYYRAKVTENNYSTNGTVKVKKPFDVAHSVKCSVGMQDVAVNSQVTVLRFGAGNNKNEVVIANGGGTDLFSLDRYYPVGSIYISVNSTSPGDLFGGTWVQIKDTFLLSAGDTYTAGTTGGEAEVTLTINEMPSHNHKYYGADFSTTITASADTVALHKSRSWEYSGNEISNTGGDEPHNNMPPYLTVYMWKRTA